MPRPPDPSSRSFRFWLVYSAVWLPYGASYAALFSLSQGLPLSSSIVSALINVVPAGLLGALVLRVPRVAPWSGALPRFIIVHLVGAIAFSVLWYVALVFGLGLRNGLGTLPWFRGAALHWMLFQGILLYLVIATVGYAVEVLRELREQRQQSADLELRLASSAAVQREAELRALRAQLDPHFIFNTLHTLQALVRYDVRRAEEGIERLGTLMRFSMAGSDRAPLELVRLRDEWEHVEAYFELEAMRLGDRLTVVAAISDAALEARIPPMTLQPLVENAIKHGIAPRPAGGIVRISATVEATVVTISVRDDGGGADPRLLERGGGRGLALVRRMLDLTWGTAASMLIESQPGRGFGVTLRIPEHSPEPSA
jgi:sensor histidine kinase YesM